MTKVVLATRNHHKVEELREILADVCGELGLDIVGLDEFPDAPDVVEDGVTLRRERCAQGAVRRGDDGPPGARGRLRARRRRARRRPRHLQRPLVRQQGPGADRANLELLLAQLGDVREAHRGAAFVCAACARPPRWTVRGRDRSLPRPGRSRAPGAGGFGYDPIFVPADQPDPGTERTLAEYARGGEERRLAPVPGLPRARAAPEGAAPPVSSTSPTAGDPVASRPPATQPGSALAGAANGLVAGLLTVGLARCSRRSSRRSAGPSARPPRSPRSAAPSSTGRHRGSRTLPSPRSAPMTSGPSSSASSSSSPSSAPSSASSPRRSSRRPSSRSASSAPWGWRRSSRGRTRALLDAVPTLLGTAVGMWFLSRGTRVVDAVRRRQPGATPPVGGSGGRLSGIRRRAARGRLRGGHGFADRSPAHLRGHKDLGPRRRRPQSLGTDPVHRPERRLLPHRHCDRRAAGRRRRVAPQRHRHGRAGD